jgi:hypothetical protein
MTRKEALEHQPWLKQTMWQRDINGQPTNLTFYYRCIHYDPETRLCMDHENRPPLCRNFPWPEGSRPNRSLRLPPMCAFNADIGKPVEPLDRPVRVEIQGVSREEKRGQVVALGRRRSQHPAGSDRRR